MMQCIVYNTPVPVALECSGSTLARQGMYKRIARWRSSLAPANLAIVQSIEVARGIRVLADAPSWLDPWCSAPPAESPSSLSSSSATASTRVNSKGVSITAAIEKALADAPSWLDPDKTLEAMTLRKKRTPSQVCRDNFDSNAERSHYGDRYSNAFKKATIKLSDSLNDDSTRGKRGQGARAIAAMFNERMLSSPSDRKIKASTLREAVTFDRVGLSPVKRGRPEKIPSKLCAALSKQSAMMHFANEREASSVKMKALTEGLIANTKWQNVFSTEYCWRKTRKNHPEILNPVKAKVNEDRRVEWLSYKNIMEWTARAKEFLITIEMAKDEPGIIREFACYALPTMIHSVTHLSFLSFLLLQY